MQNGETAFDAKPTQYVPMRAAILCGLCKKAVVKSISHAEKAAWFIVKLSRLARDKITGFNYICTQNNSLTYNA